MDSNFTASYTKDTIVSVLRQLPEEDRLVIIMKDIKKYSYSDMAKYLECPVEAIGSKLSSARRIFKNCLAGKLL